MKNLFPSSKKAQMAKSIPGFYWGLLGVIVLVIGAGLYFSFPGSSVDNEAPPSLSLEGAGYQGFLTDDRGFYEFDDGDIAAMKLRETDLTGLYGASSDRKSSPDKRAIYYYLDEDGSQSFQDTLDLIQAEVGNKCLVVTYLENEFKIYPEGPYIGTKTVTPAYKVPAGTPFSLVCRDGYETWNINSGDIQPTVDYIPLNEMDPTWNLTIFDSTEALATEVESCGSRIISIWTQTGLYMNDFVQVSNAKPVLQDGYHMVWFKLGDDAGTCAKIDLSKVAVDPVKDEGKDVKFVDLGTVLKDPALVPPTKDPADDTGTFVAPTKDPAGDTGTFVAPTKDPAGDTGTFVAPTKDPAGDTGVFVAPTKDPAGDTGVLVAPDAGDTGDVGFLDIIVTERAVDIFINRGDVGIFEDVVIPRVDVDNEDPAAVLLKAYPAVASVNLVWKMTSDNVGVTGYRVHVISPSGVAKRYLINAATFSYNVTGLDPVKYTFTVVAFDAAGNESSATVVATPWDDVVNVGDGETVGICENYRFICPDGVIVTTTPELDCKFPACPVSDSGTARPPYCPDKAEFDKFCAEGGIIIDELKLACGLTDCPKMNTAPDSKDVLGDATLPDSTLPDSTDDGGFAEHDDTIYGFPIVDFDLNGGSDFLGTTTPRTINLPDTAYEYQTQLVKELAICSSDSCRVDLFRKFKAFYLNSVAINSSISFGVDNLSLEELWDSCSADDSQLKCMDGLLAQYPHYPYEVLVYACIDGYAPNGDPVWIDPVCFDKLLGTYNYSLPDFPSDILNSARTDFYFDKVRSHVVSFLSLYACLDQTEDEYHSIDGYLHRCSDNLFMLWGDSPYLGYCDSDGGADPAVGDKWLVQMLSGDFYRLFQCNDSGWRAQACTEDEERYQIIDSPSGLTNVLFRCSPAQNLWEMAR